MSDTWDSAPLASQPKPDWQAAPVAQTTVGALGNPDEAGKALAVSQKIGVAPSVVQSDLPGYEQHMRTQEGKLAMQDPAIAAYVRNNPQAPEVSADDWPKIREASDALKYMSQDRVNARATTGLLQDIPAVAGMFGSPEGRERLWEAAKQLPKALAMGLVDFAKVPGQVQSGEIDLNTSEGLNKAIGFGLGVALGGRDITIGRAVGAEGLKPGEVQPKSFDDFMATLRGMQTRKEIDDFMASQHPQGPVALLENKSKAGAEALDGAVEAAQASNTRERSPETFAAMAAEHDPGNVHIDGKAVADLYAKEGKVPAEGDGLLGFVPGLAEKVQAAEATGGEVTVPIADYIAHVDPTVHEGLRDNVRLHDDGVTAEEAKTAKEEAQSKELTADSIAPPEDGKIRFYHGTAYEDATGFSGSTSVTPYFDYAKNYRGGNNNVLFTDLTKEEAIQRGLYDEINDRPINGPIDDGAALLKPMKAGQAKFEPKNTEPVAAATETEVNTAREAFGTKPDVFMNLMIKDGKALGITERELAQYSDKIANAEKSILDKSVEAARKFVARSLTPEWKRQEALIRDQVSAELAERGPFAAEKFLRDNKITLGGDNIDQVADDLAPIFGFDNGMELRRALTDLETTQAADRKNVRQQLKEAIEAETAKRMEASHGTLAENIAKEARQIALADHTFDVLADEVRFLAKAAGVEPPLGRQELVAWAKQTFERTGLVDAANYDKLSRAVARGGREAEKALLKGDYQEAFQAKQRQMLAATLAKESLAIQPLIDRVSAKIDRFTSEHSIKSLDQEHLEQIRGILERVGVPQDYAPTTPPADLPDFVAQSEGQLQVAPWLGQGAPKLSDMTVAQFRDFADSIASIEHVGRQMQKVRNAQGEAELLNVVGDIVKSMERFPFIDQPANAKFGNRAAGLWRRAVGMHLLVERVFDYTDQFNPHGPITEWLDRPLRDANVKEIQLTEEVTKMLRDLKPYTDKSIHDKIPNSLIRDANDKTGFMNMNRGNLRVLMLNMGNWSNMRKLTEGFGVNEADLRRFVDQHATAADVAWVNGIHQVFKRLKPEADAVQLRDTGVPVDSIPDVPWEIKGGKLDGGYYPLSYDIYNSDIRARVAQPLFDKGYFSAATPKGYTQERTGYTGAIDLSGNFLQSKIQGMVHDIAFREAVRNANKLIENQEFRTGVSQYWGKEVADLLPSWIRDIANSHNFDETYARDFVYGASLLRQNIINTLVGMNPGTVIKHGLTAAIMSADRVGVVSLAKAMVDIGASGLWRNLKGLTKREDFLPDDTFMDEFRTALVNNTTADNAREFVMQASAVMRNRQRQWEDSIRGAIDAITRAGPGKTYADLRQLSAQYGRMTIAWSDQATAMPTWLAAYKRAYMAGESHADAVFIADKEVSRAHGSNFVGDQPSVTRLPNTGTAEFMKWFTSLYRFWNHNQNNQFQLAWDASAAAGGRAEPGANAWSISRRVGLMMAIIAVEEVAGPAKDENGHGPLAHLLMASLRYFGGGWVGVREITNSVASGYEPSTGGLTTTMIKAGYDSFKDLKKSGSAKDLVKHTATTLGFLTGLGNAQIGRTAQFIKNVVTGADRPQNVTDIRQGLRTGSSKARKPR